MQSPLVMRRSFCAVVSIVVPLTAASCSEVAGSRSGDSPDDAAFVRPVVTAASPLALSNPQRNHAVWPIWGGAFAIGEATRIRAELTQSTPERAGLRLAGLPTDPEQPDARLAIEIAASSGTWSVREMRDGDVVQEIALDAGDTAELVLDVSDDGRRFTITSAGQRRSIESVEPLSATGGEIGIYASLEPRAELSIRDLALTAAAPDGDELGRPLRATPGAASIEIGSATDVWPPIHDLRFEALLGEQFTTAAATEFYWATTRGEDEEFYFLPADVMVNYAAVHGQKVHGYFLAWDFELPEWLNEVAAEGDAQRLGAILDEHIATLVGRYKGRVDAWVVVNEAIWGPDETDGDGARFAESIWSDLLGSEFIVRAFRQARKSDPGAVLLYNETGAEELGEKSDFLHAMAADFVERKVPIDGIGLQFHIDGSAPPDMAKVKANLERFGALGLAVYITELDVSLASVGGSRARKEKLQARIYADVLSVCRSVPACRSYTVFGFTDRYGWDELGDATPLLFDEAYRAKPAFFSVQSGLEE